ncbi:MAG: VOC family protein [Aurantimonas endophytica]|uniref:Glyoxalase-like domain-containing protein n=1 Tax=Aurantimonas endophytica TaxID=1522175 RepID=A0A7W6HA89_9HYPH|nr:VOC family protein [Aurantimonas endophytica]MBB4001495.1 hypothetical protein [Aurantimonas endophytica]MCO6402864.1 VOC family protein [Aurantimonas endophytica]
MRPIDHVVLPFPDLPSARSRLEALGFTVAPDAVHPFGTGNACVFFADGAYLEPLAVVDHGAYGDALGEGNLFVQHDAAFRSANPLPAFSGLALRSDDALVDRDTLAEHGLGEDGVVEFSRDLVSPDGTSATLSFRLTFARSPADFGATLFFCQKLHRMAPDRAALTCHPNGVTGLSRIVLVGEVSPATRLLLESASGVLPTAEGAGTLRLALAESALEIVTDDIAAERYGSCRKDGRGLVIAGIVLSVTDLVATRAAVGSAVLSDQPGRLTVPLDAGGSAFITFEETPA